jgi:O-antigen/teichoic acid export membrane protein
MTTTSTPDNVKKEAISGAVRTALFTVIGRLTTLMALFFTGSLLPKEAFAMYAFCYSASAIFFGLGRGSVMGILLQRPKFFYRIKNQAFNYSLTINSCAVLIGIATILFSNRLFNSWQVLLVGITLAVRALLMTPIALSECRLSSALAFRELTRVRITSITLKNLSSILLAFAGAGVHSLSLPFLLTGIYELVRFRSIAAVLGAGDNAISRAPSKRVAGWIFKRSYWLIVVTILTACMMNVDYLVVGQLGTTSQLALYYFAFQLTASVLEILVSGIQTVTIPVLVALKEQRRDVGSSIVKVASILNLIALPTGIALATSVAPAICLLWGTKWIDAIPCSELLALGIIPRAYILLLNATLDASGAWRTRASMLLYDIIGIALVTFAGLFSGGIFYISLYLLIYSCFYSLVWCYVVAKKFNIRPILLVKTSRTNLLVLTFGLTGYCALFHASGEPVVPWFGGVLFITSWWWGCVFIVQGIALLVLESRTVYLTLDSLLGPKNPLKRFSKSS